MNHLQDFDSDRLALVSSECNTIGVPELDPFVDRGLITRIHASLTSGKEGAVFCCRAHPSTRSKFLAAKVYREHAASAHKWSATYFEGRERNLKETEVRAIQRRTAFGRRLAGSLWVEAEFTVLKQLATAGADTPRPVACADRAILMEYIGNGAQPAPHLDGVQFRPHEARRVYAQILDNITLFLANNLVHGDLSPYNILYWKDQAWIIDVPQAVDARFNHSALTLLHRDVKNVQDHFARFGVSGDAARIADDLWNQYRRAAL